ncbi:ABC transporter substrate-binding protein [Microbacterium invictum]|uniref:ABC-type glycerol-3-phosphate transport system substrate-binding protein n=1 Tax=Microbacterium invictum TaxID=515415 RepID=A0AA40VK66_9MICO|nr:MULTISPECIES: ABC transporter substrate-binding protein [Microbacterium]MBB4138346.1 ABC-type glycerol-3-phosphate transport system substrate-binding protein [Microbacterium invictum]
MTMGQHKNRLAALAVLGTIGLVAVGCSGGNGDTPDEEVPGSDQDFSGETLNVVAAWSGAEQANFEAVLDVFEEATGATVTYTSFGDNGPTYIQGQLAGGTPPNVAVIGQPALMQSLAGNGDILPVDDTTAGLVADNYSQSWIDLGSVDGELYGVWFKAANKSTVWYNDDIYSEAGASVPEDWDGFLEQLEVINDSGYSGISVGADVGWPLTDWFENVYLRTAGGDMYDQLTGHEIPWTDPSVQEALEVMATLWSSPALQPGGAQRTFPESVTAVFGADPEAGTVFEGDFVAGNITDDGNSVVGENALFYDFPSVNGSAPAVVGGGDVAVQFTDDEATAALMAFLASPGSAEAWVPNGGLTSPNTAVDTSLYPDDISRQIAEALTGAEEFRFDMSDLTPSAFGGTAGQGFWQEMITFYENPDDVQGTMERLEAAAAAAY